MGTNYYLHENVCERCERSDVTHICKSFTSWHGSVDGITAPNSVAGWRERIKAAVAKGGYIEDEYGTPVTAEEFFRAIENVPPHRARQQYDSYMRHGYHDGVWLDPDGFSFSSAEFS